MAGRRFESALPPAERRTGAAASAWLEPEAKALLRKYDIPLPEERLARSGEEAAALAREIGFPVALKIVSRDVLHKSDAGCVKLNLAGSADVEQAFAEIMANARRCVPNADIAGALVARMDLDPGVEVIIGGLNDPTFGPTIMFGLGGIFVETLKDIAFRVCPLDETDAAEMIREIKGFPVLAGARGAPAADLEAIKRALLNVSQLLIEHREIEEVDLNPIKVHVKGLLALDARVIASGEPQ